MTMSALFFSYVRQVVNGWESTKGQVDIEQFKRNLRRLEADAQEETDKMTDEEKKNLSKGLSFLVRHKSALEADDAEVRLAPMQTSTRAWDPRLVILLLSLSCIQPASIHHAIPDRDTDANCFVPSR